MKKAKCPACEKIIYMHQEIKIRELVTCPHCKSVLELVDNFPPSLDWAEDPVVYSPYRKFKTMH